MPANPSQVSLELSDAPEADDWIVLRTEPLPVEVASSWVVRPDCGGVVVFFGTVRDHAEGRSGVSELVYEAYPEVAKARMSDLAAASRRRWPDLGRIAVWHRTGRLEVTDVAVVVAVSAPHRDAAFDAGRWLIDTVKTDVPIWKHETWAEGQGWGVDARPLAERTP